MNMLTASRRSLGAGMIALAILASLNTLGADYNRNLTTATGNEWWTTGTWAPSDWVNDPTSVATITNTTGAATTLTIAQDVVANALSFRGTSGTSGHTMTLAPVTSGTPESFTLDGNNQTITLSFGHADNNFAFDVPFTGDDITLYSVGGMTGSTQGGLTFGNHVPVWNTLRVKTGNLMFRDAFNANFANYSSTVILDGGGINTRNYGQSGVGSGIFNFPLQVGQAGGYLRTYSSSNVRFNGTISDEIAGNSGILRRTDGGILTLAGSLAGFTGTLRNEAGTMVVRGNALDFTGRLEQASAIFVGGNTDYDDLLGATQTFSPTAIVATAGAFNTRFHNGTLIVPSPMNLSGYYDARGSALVRLTGNHARTFNLVLYDANGGFELAGGSITTPAGANQMLTVNASGTDKTIIQRSGTEWTNGGTGVFALDYRAMFTQDAGALLDTGGAFFNIISGKLTQSGTLKAHGIQVGTSGTTGQADLQMDAGKIIVGAGGLSRRASNASITFNGGTLAGTGPITTSAPFTAGGNVTMDTTGGDITLSGTVNGTGKLIVTGSNTLAVADLQAAVEIDDARLLPSYTAVNLPALTTTSADSILGIRLAASTSGASTKYTATGNIALADGTQFDINLYEGTYASGQTYVLMETTGGTLTANPSTLRAPLFEQSRSYATFTVAGNQLLITITQVNATVYWKETGDTGTWDTTTVAWNQSQGASGANDTFYLLDSVVFNDVPLQSQVTVEIPSVVVPTSVTVANASTDFTLTGAGISGGAPLTKNGTGTLIYDAPWLSTGQVTLNSGVLDWRSPGTFPASQFTVASGMTLKLNHPSAAITASANLWNNADLYLGAGTFTVSASSQASFLGTVTISNGMLVTSSGVFNKELFLNGGTTGGLDMSNISGTAAMNGRITGTGDFVFKARGNTTDSGGGVGDQNYLDNAANDFDGKVILASGMTRATSYFGKPSNPIVLNGGGVVYSGTTALTMNRDLLVGPNGGFLRTYGSAQAQVWNKKFANLVPGTVGTVSHTDGGPVRFTGDISGFTGAYRKAFNSANAITTIGDGGLLPCDEMRWQSIYINGQSVIFDFANAAFKAGFSTTGSNAGALRKRGTGTLIFTNNVTGAIAHMGGTFVDEGKLQVQSLLQFADNSTNTISKGAVLEQLATGALPATAGRKLMGDGTLKISLAGTHSADPAFYSTVGTATNFTGTLDLHCTGDGKLRGFGPGRLAPNATIQINEGALWFITAAGTYPYNLKIAGKGNTEQSTGFGAIRVDPSNASTFSGNVALIGDARLYGAVTSTGTISNECATAKTLSFGGTYATGWTANLNGHLTDGNAPLGLALTHNNTLNIRGEDNCISGTLTVSAGTVNIAAGSTQVGDIVNATAINVADGAALLTSGTGTGGGTYTFGEDSVLGFAAVMDADGKLSLPHLTAQTLTFPATAKVTAKGIDLLEQEKVSRLPVLTFPTAAFAGVPDLAAPLPGFWAFTRKDNGDATSTLFLSKALGTMILIR